jgi:hypothetical protein
MEAVSALDEVIGRSVDKLEPASFRDRLLGVASGTSRTPGVLAIQTARALDPAADIETSATRGAGVQLSYTGLELTRSILREQRWEEGDTDDYYYDLLAAEILVSRGLYYLSGTGVRRQAVEIVQKFGRTQTETAELGTRHAGEPLEMDVIRLAVDAGADLVMQTTPPSLATYREELADDLREYPLPEPDDALAGVDERLTTLVADRELREADG